MALEQHLQMIQSIVSRLASQSTSAKGWCITITAAVLSFGAASGNPAIASIVVYVVLAFAVLDAYYLALERSYRTLFRDATNGAAPDWGLAVSTPSWRSILGAFRSPSIYLLYGASMLAAIAMLAYLITK